MIREYVELIKKPRFTLKKTAKNNRQNVFIYLNIRLNTRYTRKGKSYILTTNKQYYGQLTFALFLYSLELQLIFILVLIISISVVVTVRVVFRYRRMALVRYIYRITKLLLTSVSYDRSLGLAFSPLFSIGYLYFIIFSLTSNFLDPSYRFCILITIMLMTNMSNIIRTIIRNNTDCLPIKDNKIGHLLLVLTLVIWSTSRDNNYYKSSITIFSTDSLLFNFAVSLLLLILICTIIILATIRHEKGLLFDRGKYCILVKNLKTISRDCKC